MDARILKTCNGSFVPVYGKEKLPPVYTADLMPKFGKGVLLENDGAVRKTIDEVISGFKKWEFACLYREIKDGAVMNETVYCPATKKELKQLSGLKGVQWYLYPKGCRCF